MLRDFLFTFRKFYNRNVPEEARHNFMVELISYTLLGISNGFVVPFFYLISVQEFHASPFWLGVMTASTGIGFILSFLTTGFTKQGKELPVYVSCLFLGRLLIIGLVFSLNAPMYALFIFFNNLLQNLPFPQYGIIAQNIYPDHCRASLISYTKIALTVTTLIATVLGGYLIEIFSWKIVFFLSGVFALVSTLILLKFKLPKTEPVKPLPIKDYIVFSFDILKKDALNRNIIIGAFIFVIGVQLTVILMPMTQVDILNISSNQLGILNAIMTVVWVLAFGYFGKYIDKKGPLRALHLSFIIYIFMTVFYVFARDWKDLILSFVIYGIFRGCNDLAYFNLIIYLSPKGKENLYQGMNSLWLGVRSALDVLFATWIINYVLGCDIFSSLRGKHNALYVIAMLFMLASVIFQSFAFRKHYDIKRH